MACLSACDAVILAGGAGSRLRPVLPDRPKALALVGGVPFLRQLLEQVRSFGTRRVILALGHLAEAVESYLAGGSWDGLELVASVEREPLGTGGALRSVLPLLRTPTALVMNGDSFTEADLCGFLAFHRSRRAQVSLLSTYLADVDRYGLVEVEGEVVTAFHEKPSQGQRGGYINTGLYLLDTAVVGQIPADRPVSLEREVLPRLCQSRCYAMRGEFPFMDIGTPEAYRAADAFFRERIAS